jgi:hypothetical protein
VELSQFKSLEPQLSDDSPLENFVRLTEDPGGTQGGPSTNWGPRKAMKIHGKMSGKVRKKWLAFGSKRLLFFYDL